MYILQLGLFYAVTARTVVCCILMQILYVVSQKSFSFWGTSSPRCPTGTPPLDPAGGLPSPRLPVFFYVPPNNPVRSTPLVPVRVSQHVLPPAVLVRLYAMFILLQLLISWHREVISHTLKSCWCGLISAITTSLADNIINTASLTVW